MARKPPFQDWKFAHVAMVVTVVAICAAFFVFTGDADLFVAGSIILTTGLLAILGAQLHVWFEARHDSGRER